MSVFLSGLLYVFLLGIQQQNITHKQHGWSAVTSFALAAALALVVQGAVQGRLWWFVLLYGAGSAAGASLSIIVHRRWINRGVIGDPL